MILTPKRIVSFSVKTGKERLGISARRMFGRRERHRRACRHTSQYDLHGQAGHHGLNDLRF